MCRLYRSIVLGGNYFIGLVRPLLLSLFLIANCVADAQTITYYEDIQPIFQKKCFNCHAKGKNYFLFDTFSKIRSKLSMLNFVIENDIMPPWPVDDNYQSYQHSRPLTTDEKSLITKWMNSGFPEGRAHLIRSTKTKERKGKTISFKIHSILLPANEKDTFIIFKLPYAHNKGYMINKIEFKSSVLSYIHHVNLFIGVNNSSIQDANFVYGYAPGMDQNKFSGGQGFYLSNKGVVGGDIHIPPISKPLKIDLDVVFSVAEDMIEHELFFFGREGFKLKNMANLIIPSDSVINIEGSMQVKQDLYFTHIMPHMHLLGKKIKVWIVDTDGNQTPLIKIDNWLFQWQNYYEFNHPILVKNGSTIMVEAVYDNTSENKANPNFPPKTVSEGWLSGQEMLSVFILAYNTTGK
jgi:hypothetical protein